MTACRLLPWAVALALGAGPLAAMQPLSLAEALHLAGRGSLEADLAGFANQGALQDRRAAQASYLPEISFQGGRLIQDHRTAMRTEPFSLAGIQVPAMESPANQKNAWRYRLTADYLLYDFGKRSGAVAAAAARERAVALQGADKVLRAQAEVVARYMEVLNLKARRKVVAQRQQALQDLLKDARALFAEGVVARNDVLRTEVAARSVEDAAQSLETGLLAAGEQLEQALGLSAGAGTLLPETVPAPPPLPWDEAAAAERAQAGNPGLRALQAQVEAAQALTRRCQADGGPNLVAQLEHGFQENRYLMNPHQTSLLVGVSWKLFEGGARAARLAKARAEDGAARREQLDGARRVRDGAAQAHRAFRQALREWDTARENAAAAGENLRIVQDQYHHGYARNAEVLDAETVLAESRFSLADRQSQAYVLQAALLALLGEDLETFYASARQEQ